LPSKEISAVAMIFWYSLVRRLSCWRSGMLASQNSFFCKSMETKYCLPNSRSMSARKGLAAMASLSATSSPLSVGSVSCK